MNTVNSTINIEKDVNIHLENKSVSRHFFLFLWITYAIVSMTKNCYNGAMASIVSEGILTKSQTGFITAMFYLVYTPLQIAGGVISDRFSPEKMIKIGLLGAAIANTVIFFNQNYYVMLTAWIFNAAVQFGIWPAIFKIVSSQLVRSDRKSMAFYLSFSSTGGLLLSYLVAAIVPKWEYNFAVSAIFLMILTVCIHIYSIHLNPLMKWDRVVEEKISTVLSKTKENSLANPFVSSGFFVVVLVVVLAILVNQSRSSLTPIMLVESYENISPAIANSLNIIMVLSTMAGTFLAGKLAKNVQNEIKAMLILYSIMVPVLAFASFVGKLPIPFILIPMCIAAALESFCALMRTNYTMRFAKYGKSGTAAGIINSGMALSYMLSAYALTRVAEKFGWSTVTTLWPIFIAIAVIALLTVFTRYKKFIKMQNNM